MMSDTRAGVQSDRDVGDLVLGPAGGAPHNEHLMSDPIGAEVGPARPIDTGAFRPPRPSGAIDGLPGRFERRAIPDDDPKLDLARRTDTTP